MTWPDPAGVLPVGGDGLTVENAVRHITERYGQASRLGIDLRMTEILMPGRRWRVPVFANRGPEPAVRSEGAVLIAAPSGPGMERTGDKFPERVEIRV